MLLSYATVDFYLFYDGAADMPATVVFYLFYDGAADMQIWALLTRSQCRVSDTQVTIKALGPLFSLNIFFSILGHDSDKVPGNDDQKGSTDIVNFMDTG